jgi:hypothetical protein
MKTAAILLSTLSVASAFVPSQNAASCTALKAALPRETVLSEPDTTEFGKIWDPLGLAEMGSDETIAWFRHSEVKHGRVAMAAFVGWWAVGAGLRLPGELAYGLNFADIPSKGLEAWDAVPGWGKAQMLLFAGLIEFHDELFYSRRGTHYMRGGTPGKVSLSIIVLSKNEARICISHRITFCLYFLLICTTKYRTWFLDFSILLVCPQARAQKRRHVVVPLRSRMVVLQ